jgi:hypothetical protein
VIATTSASPVVWAQKPGVAAPAKGNKPAPPAKPKPAPKPPRPPAAPKDPPKAGTDPAKTPKVEPPKAGPVPAGPVAARESRIEFDERMVRGQSAAGAVYLFQRSPSEFKSIVQVPESFRARTVELLAQRKAAP